jgi:hypothetical protein
MKALITAGLLCMSTLAFAQNRTSGGCGTITPQSELDKIYDFVQHNPDAYANKTAGVMDSIPLSIHIIGTDAGGGYYPLNNLFPVLCQLNERFAPVNFHFYVKWPINYHNSSDYYIHDFWGGGMMMNQYNVANAVNVYFVQDPAGNCGYYTYGQDAVAIGKNCAGSNSTTLTHELGHYFSLPHTFSGWENGNTPGNPEVVRRSGPGTNCNSTGDGFCDTDADYISDRWNCPAPVGKTDPYGDLYRLDSSMYMSYSSDKCQSRFSVQQIAKMQNNLHVNRLSFSGAVNPKPQKLDTARILYPADTMYANVKKATWRKVPGADYYYVRVTLQSAPSYIVQSTLTRDTSMPITYNIVDGGMYLLDVAPLNAHNVCMEYSKLTPFIFADKYKNLSVPAAGTAEAQLKVYPNPVAQGSELQLNFQTLPIGSYSISLISISGQELASQQFFNSASNGTTILKTQSLADGIYFLRWKGEAGQGAVRLRIGQ